MDEFYSAWRMRPVQGKNGGVACEVVLQHFEEMGIQHDLAKLAIRRGMWYVRVSRALRPPALTVCAASPRRGCVQNMERGLCAFVKKRRERLRVRASRRSSGAAPSSPKRSAGMPRSLERESPRPTPLAVLLKTGLMAIGGVTVARHAAGAGPQLAGAVGSVIFRHGKHRRHSAPGHANPEPVAL